MAIETIIFSAPEDHIDFMIKHPGVAVYYYMGEPPVPTPKKVTFIDKLLGRKAEKTKEGYLDTPLDWPKDEANSVDMMINHRNAQLYHWILNQTSEPVTGVGCIFYNNDNENNATHSLGGGDLGAYALLPDQLPELLSLVETVTLESLREAFRAWCKNEGKEYQPSQNDEDMHAEFVDFANYLKKAISNKHGLVCIFG